MDLCDLLRPKLVKKSTNFKNPMPVEKKVLASISLLADGAFQRCQEKFGLAQSTMSVLFSEFLDALYELRDFYVCISGELGQRESKKYFWE